jgi:zinc/manganese transport system substrate-binding protein
VVRTVLISFLVAGAAILAACGSDDEPGSGVNIVATTGIAADLAEAVGGGDVELDQIVPDSASPHDFQLSAQDRQALEEADLVVSIGSGLEPGIPLDEIDAPQWALTEHVGELLPFTEAGAHEEEHAAEEHAEDEHAAEDDEHAAEEEDDEHGSSDPHVWMDPTRVADSLPSLAEALGAADPDRAAGYRARADEYSKELRDLDAELERTLEAIPAADRELVTSHDSLGYFADRYGFDVVATAFPATGPEAEASAAALRDVTDAVTEAGVPAVFAQADDDPDALTLVAEDAGVAIEENLLVEAPGDAGSYVEMLRRDAQLIAAALAP